MNSSLQQRASCQPKGCAPAGHLIGHAHSIGRRRANVLRPTAAAASADAVQPGSTVLVVGPTGGVGQIATAKLLERGYRVRALARNAAKARGVLGSHELLEVVEGDCREATGLPPLVAGVDAVCCCTGTTAFPSDRWRGNNGPRPTDLVGTTNLIAAAAAAQTVARFVLVTSAGVERQLEFPWRILNLYGVLGFKRESELALIASGMPYTVLRPSRLTDGPYTSFDVNTLLKATAGSRQAVQLASTDSLFGEASRIAVAEAAVQALGLPCTRNRVYALASQEGAGPGVDAASWRELFQACYA